MNSLLGDLTFSTLLCLAGAALVHATLQVSVSVLTLLTSHSLGRQRAHMALLRMNFSYIIGVTATTIGLIALSQYKLATWTTPQFSWALITMLCAMIAGVVIFYYYRGMTRGTVLWVPRPFADYLISRAKKTTSSVEAAGLGVVTAIAELPFSIGAILIVANLLRDSGPSSSLAIITGYSLVVALPLLVITAMIGAGHPISTVQRWREQSRSFLRYTAGTGYLVLAFYLTTTYLMEPSL